MAYFIRVTCQRVVLTMLLLNVLRPSLALRCYSCPSCDEANPPKKIDCPKSEDAVCVKTETVGSISKACAVSSTKMECLVTDNPRTETCYCKKDLCNISRENTPMRITILILTVIVFLIQ
ncbi:unnamed protein product [Allacma fusca]|uniref:Uncharacterized protein n=1 Tax=Allacma fusca TaxID=39272 RepID=A0A8J2KDA0_9HEXA|nr:unnamed protein product [Allacma fusca]